MLLEQETTTSERGFVDDLTQAQRFHNFSILVQEHLVLLCVYFCYSSPSPSSLRLQTIIFLVTSKLQTIIFLVTSRRQATIFLVNSTLQTIIFLVVFTVRTTIFLVISRFQTIIFLVISPSKQAFSLSSSNSN